MTPNNPSKPVPLEVVDSDLLVLVTKAMHRAELSHQLTGPLSKLTDQEIVDGYWDQAQAAILAADETRGLRVETFETRSRVPGQPRIIEQRLVSDWFPIKGPVDE